MSNLQKNLNIIWQPPSSRHPLPNLPNPTFSSKNFQTPQFRSILKKSTPPPSPLPYLQYVSDININYLCFTRRSNSANLRRNFF